MVITTVDSSVVRYTLGTCRSCFPRRNGTPRQSGIADIAKGVIEIRPAVNPSSCLQGLQG